MIVNNNDPDYQEALIELDKEFPGAELDSSLEFFLLSKRKNQSITNIALNLFLTILNPFFFCINVMLTLALSTLITDFKTKVFTFVFYFILVIFNSVWNTFIIRHINDEQ